MIQWLITVILYGMVVLVFMNIFFSFRKFGGMIILIKKQEGKHQGGL